MSRVSRKVSMPQILTLLGDIHPHGFFVESILIGIEATERRIAL